MPVVLLCALTGLVGLWAAVTSIATVLKRPARGNWNDTAAIGALKTIGAAQDLFREGDRERDGVLDYGTLSELSTAGASGGLIDAVLGSGTKQGYFFECSYSTTTSKLWFATARPALPLRPHGDRFFATNQNGVVYYSRTAPIPMNTDDCTFPTARLKSGDVRPLGR